MKYEVRIDDSLVEGGHNVWLIKRDLVKRTSWSANPIDIVFKEMPANSFLPEPTLKIRHEDNEIFKALADALIKQNCIPDEYVFNTKEKEALKYHLEDMRTMAFKGNT